MNCIVMFMDALENIDAYKERLLMGRVLEEITFFNLFGGLELVDKRFAF